MLGVNVFKTREVVLKNNIPVVIRQAVLSDAEGILNAINKYIPESEYIPLKKNELSQSIEEKEEWIKGFLDYENSLLLVAEYNDEIIGNIDLTGSRREIMSHTALIGMGLLTEWRSCGLGTNFLSLLIEWAKSNTVLELLWLQVYTENREGFSLYKKMGFIENGIIRNFFKQDDRYFHNLTMSLDVSKGS